ncbi:MAG: metallophosphoesterase [Deltaproteobacteria bacterium]|nr:metallophosphoesterase [Deltaproteobacteria bacterium]
MHTVVVSDLHLSDAVVQSPKRPHWLAYKQARFFFDGDIERLCTHVREQSGGEPCELVLNGDIFDFDCVTAVPKDAGPGEVDWLAKLRGLGSQEWMSVFKMRTILADHPVFLRAIADWLRAGNRAIFIIGNHDAELHWPKVQQTFRDALDLGLQGSVERQVCEDRVVFCNWFYVSESDTFLSHGHQYDPYCLVLNPIDPLISVRGKPHVRIPFGDLCGRYMLNGMGYFNPHATSNYIMTATQYARFFFKYMFRTQPLLLWTWFWGAMVTLFVSVTESWRPAMSDPLLVEEKVQHIAEKAHATPPMVRRLRALDAEPALANPISVMRELWLDRGLMALLIIYLGFQMVLAINVVWSVSPKWWFVPALLLSPLLVFYHFRIRSAVFAEPLLSVRNAELIHKITNCRRVIFGHTHEPVLQNIGPVEYINGGFWSPAFSDPECKNRVGTQSFVWVRPEGSERRAYLLEWPQGAEAPKPLAVGADLSPDASGAASPATTLAPSNSHAARASAS